MDGGSAKHDDPTQEDDTSQGFIRKESYVKKKRSATVDRGYSWVVMISTFTLFCLFSGNFTAHGVFLPEFVDYFRVSKAEAAVAGSLTVGLAGIIGIILGPLTKKFGTRIVVIIGGLLSGLGTAAASFAHNLTVINILLGALPGIGIGCHVIGGTVATLEYFQKRRTLAFGVAVTGFSVGSFASPQIIRYLVSEYGWRGAMLIQGGIQLNGIVCGALLRPQKKAHTEEKSVKEGAFTWKEKLKILLDFTLFKDAKYPIYITGVSLNKAGHIVPFMFLPARALSTGSSKVQAATLVTIMAACSGIFRPLFGFLGDRLGTERIIAHGLAGILSGTLHAISYFISSYIEVAVYCGIVGVLSAGYISMENTVLGDIIPATKLAHATGFYMFIYGIGSMLAPPLAGLVVDVTGNFATPFLVFGIAQILGGFCSCIIYIIQRNQLRLNKHSSDLTIDQEGVQL